MNQHVKSDYSKFDSHEYIAHGVGIVISGNKVVITDLESDSHSDDDCNIEITPGLTKQVNLLLTYSNNTFKLNIDNKYCASYEYNLGEYNVMVKSSNYNESEVAIVIDKFLMYNQDPNYSRELKKNSVKKETKKIKESNIGYQKIIMKTHPLDTNYHLDKSEYWDVKGISQMNYYSKTNPDTNEEIISYVQFIDNSGNKYNCNQFNMVDKNKWKLKTIFFKNKNVEYINIIYQDVIDEIKFKLSQSENNHNTEKAGNTLCKTCKARKATLNVKSDKITNIRMSCNNKGTSNLAFRYQVDLKPNTHDLIHEHAHIVSDSFVKSVQQKYNKQLTKYSKVESKDLSAMAMAQNEIIDLLAYKNNYYLNNYEEYLNNFLDMLQNTHHRIDELFKTHHSEVVNKTDVPGLDPRRLSQQFAKEYGSMDEMKSIIQKTVETKFKGLEDKFNTMQSLINDKLRNISEANRTLYLRNEMMKNEEGVINDYDAYLFGIFGISYILVLYIYNKRERMRVGERERERETGIRRRSSIGRADGMMI
eukprot:Mrub_01688.p1 GENE.Mrub_01688~~Mrub_01688.p1  ORF type:complete len:624 (+),score=101.57 Mrub_01688:275-1873(+)